MTVEEFVDRLIKILDLQNQENTDGQNILSLTQDQQLLLLDETSVENAVLRAKTFSPGFELYVNLAANPEYNLENVTGNVYDDSFFGAQAQYFNFLNNQPDYLGVTADYEPPSGGTDFYTTDDVVNIFAGKSTEEKAAIQADLVNAGLLQMGSFKPGTWDLSTQNAFKYILSAANQIGVTPEQKKTGARWKEVLTDYANNPLTVPKPEAVYLPPDYDSVTNQVKNVFRQSLRRDPKNYELQLLANVLLSESKKQFEQQQKLSQLADDIDVTGEQLLTGSYGNHISSTIKKAAEGMEQISPTDAMYSKFEEITKKEKERLGRNYDIQAVNSIILNSITGAPR